MRKLNYLLVFLLATQAVAEVVGYPVYKTLKTYTYDIDYGTAFAVTWKDQAYLITNWHVCRHFKSSEIKNELMDYKAATQVIREFPEEDLCVMTFPGSKGLSVGPEVKVGWPVYTGGYPQGSRDHLILRSGMVTGRSNTTLDFGVEQTCPKSFRRRKGIDPKTKKMTQYCEYTFPLQDTTLLGKPGCSGSPVLNSKSQLIGVVNSTNDGTLSYIPVSVLVKVLESL